MKHYSYQIPEYNASYTIDGNWVLFRSDPNENTNIYALKVKLSKFEQEPILIN